MDEIGARAEMTEAVDDRSLAITVPKSEVELVLDGEEDIDLVLDVVRTNGEREERRIVLAWDRDALRDLVDQAGEQVTLAIDPASLQQAFEADVEAHGVREVGAALAIAVTALGAAGMAGAATPQGAGFQPGSTDFPAAAQTQSGSDFQPGTTDFPSSLRATVVEAGMPRAMPSDYVAAEEASHDVLPSSHIAAQPVDSLAAIERVRAGDSAVPDPDQAIEQVRADRAPAAADDGGGTAIDVPSTGVTAALAGGAALTIAAAAFALRRRREPEPAI